MGIIRLAKYLDCRYHKFQIFLGACYPDSVTKQLIPYSLYPISNFLGRII